MRIPDVFVPKLTFPDLDWERTLPDDEARPYMDNIANNRRRLRHVDEDYPNKRRRVQYGKEMSRESASPAHQRPGHPNLGIKEVEDRKRRRNTMRIGEAWKKDP